MTEPTPKTHDDGPAEVRNEKALARFVQIVGEIRTALEAIQQFADDHFHAVPEEVHWGHVGDAGRTLEGLNEILATLRDEVD